MRRFAPLSLVALVAAFAWTTAALAQYPARTVEFVVSTAPGGGHDGYVRTLAAKLQEKWGTPIVVVNKPGANVTLAEGYVANAAPDGHTVLFVNSQRTINAATGATNVGYDIVDAFAPITQVGKQPQIMVINKDLSAKTLPEVVALAKASPGKLNYGDSGPGSSADLAMKVFMQKTGTSLFEISYKSQPELLLAMISGEIQISFGNVLTLRPHIDAGKVIPIGVTDTVRSSVFPQLPTVAEALKLDSFVYTSWYGVFVPAKTPKDIIEKLNRDIVAIINLPEVKDPLARDGLEIIGSTPDAFDKVIKAETVAWKGVMAK